MNEYATILQKLSGLNMNVIDTITDNISFELHMLYERAAHEGESITSENVQASLRKIVQVLNVSINKYNIEIKYLYNKDVRSLTCQI